jgi:glycosyltransferase involved in cell wall biosynthesis
VASFDLIVATVDRTEELGALLSSLDEQTHRDFRVLVVDQNEDDRIAALLEDRTFEREHIRSPRGLSRARNAALDAIRGDVVAFPDDDCTYPPDLLERVARHFDADPSLDGLTGRGGPSPPWKREPARLTKENLWNRAISYAMFLRAELVARVGTFDEELGLGCGRASASGEEIDYIIRAVDAGARIVYDPSLVVHHPQETRNRRKLASRDGASIGYILRKHGYSRLTLAQMLVRPAGGALLASLRGDRERASFHWTTLRGRARGYRRATRT